MYWDTVTITLRIFGSLLLKFSNRRPYTLVHPKSQSLFLIWVETPFQKCSTHQKYLQVEIFLLRRIWLYFSRAIGMSSEYSFAIWSLLLLSRQYLQACLFFCGTWHGRGTRLIIQKFFEWISDTPALTCLHNRMLLYLSQ